MRQKNLTDQPCISRREAAILFNLGSSRFDEKWENYYSYKIPHVQTVHGIQISLYDAVAFAYPKIKKPGEIGALCVDFTFRLAAMRKQRRHGTKGNGGKDK